jgi:hypothetical protein
MIFHTNFHSHHYRMMSATTLFTDDFTFKSPIPREIMMMQSEPQIRAVGYPLCSMLRMRCTSSANERFAPRLLNDYNPNPDQRLAAVIRSNYQCRERLVNCRRKRFSLVPASRDSD